MPPENEPPYDSIQKKSSAGATSGIIIILLLLIIGALYFWSVYQMKKNNPTPLPLIPGDVSTTTAQ